MALFPARTINMKSAGATRRVLSEMPRPTITPTTTTTIVEPSWVTALRNAVEMRGRMLGRPSSDGQVDRREPGVRAQEVEQEADRRACDHRDQQRYREGQSGRRGGVQATSHESRETPPSHLRPHGVRSRRGRVGRGPTSSLDGNDRSDDRTQTDRDDDKHPQEVYRSRLR